MSTYLNFRKHGTKKDPILNTEFDSDNFRNPADATFMRNIVLNWLETNGVGFDDNEEDEEDKEEDHEQSRRQREQEENEMLRGALGEDEYKQAMLRQQQVYPLIQNRMQYGNNVMQAEQDEGINWSTNPILKQAVEQLRTHIMEARVPELPISRFRYVPNGQAQILCDLLNIRPRLQQLNNMLAKVKFSMLLYGFICAAYKQNVLITATPLDEDELPPTPPPSLQIYFRCEGNHVDPVVFLVYGNSGGQEQYVFEQHRTIIGLVETFKNNINDIASNELVPETDRSYHANTYRRIPAAIDMDQFSHDFDTFVDIF